MVITLMVNVYAEDPRPAVEAALQWVSPIDRVVCLHGRYDGFPQLDECLERTIAGYESFDGAAVYESEHAKRNRMLELAGRPDPERWLFWLDADEIVRYASPLLDLQLGRIERLGRSGDVAGVRFHESPLGSPALEDPRRSARDHVVVLPRLIRHLPGLAFTHRHDHLVDGRRVLVGWPDEQPQPVEEVDVVVVHERWRQARHRLEAKHGYYSGETRSRETAARSSGAASMFHSTAL